MIYYKFTNFGKDVSSLIRRKIVAQDYNCGFEELIELSLKNNIIQLVNYDPKIHADLDQNAIRLCDVKKGKKIYMLILQAVDAQE